MWIRIIYEPVKAYAIKTGRCIVCGRPAKLSKTFEQTINPFNTNKEGSVKTIDEIWVELMVERREWLDKPIIHIKCEKMGG